jgi:hypothetical protein
MRRSAFGEAVAEIMPHTEAAAETVAAKLRSECRPDSSDASDAAANDQHDAGGTPVK